MSKDTGKCILHPESPKNAADISRLEAEAAEGMEFAAIRLILRQPFFGTLLSGMRRVPLWSIPTMATDYVNMYYNPAFVVGLPTDELRGCVCHEILHVAFIHGLRRGNRENEKWNVACDYAINIVIKEEAEMALPNFTLYNEEYRGMSAEQIYALLPDSPSKGMSTYGAGKEKKGNGEDTCPCCQASAGQWKTWDTHMEPSEEINEDKIVQRVVEAAEAARAQGKLPCGVERLVKELRDPKVDWRKYIRGRSLDIFNRRDYHPEVGSLLRGTVAKSMGFRSTWLPGLAAEEARLLCLIVDTSGSISKDILLAFASEIKGCMELADRTIAISCDAAVHEVVELTKHDDLLQKISFKGGGGTDFRPPFELLREKDLNPAMIVYFTDGYGTFPDRSDVRSPVLWAFTKEHAPAPWGDSVTVDDPY